MRILRDGQVHVVVDETPESFCVEVEFDYARAPYKRKLRLWWDKALCKVVNDAEADQAILDAIYAEMDAEEAKRCPKCCGTGLLHKAPHGWDGCLQNEAGGRCCDWETKVCPECQGTGEKSLNKL